MRAAKTAGTARAQSKTLFKPALASPFSMPWQPLSVEQSLQAINILQQRVANAADSSAQAKESSAAANAAAASPATIAAASSSAAAAAVAAPPVAARATKKRKRDAQSSAAAIAADDDDSAAASSSSAAFPGLFVGINAVTRAAEQDQLALLIVCRSVTPLALLAHLPLLCHLRRIPLLTLHTQVNSRMLAYALHAPARATRQQSATSADDKKQRGIQLCMALGFKVSCLPCIAAHAHMRAASPVMMVCSAVC
jgi:ribosomal protein L7Ae-like RNA K-turn-binding protein